MVVGHSTHSQHAIDHLMLPPHGADRTGKVDLYDAVAPSDVTGSCSVTGWTLSTDHGMEHSKEITKS